MPGGARNRSGRAWCCFNISTFYLAIGRLGSFGVCRPLLRTIYETVLASMVFYSVDSQEGDVLGGTRSSSTYKRGSAVHWHWLTFLLCNLWSCLYFTHLLTFDLLQLWNFPTLRSIKDLILFYLFTMTSILLSTPLHLVEHPYLVLLCHLCTLQWGWFSRVCNLCPFPFK